MITACHNSEEITEESGQQKDKNIAAAGYNVRLGMAYLKQGDTPRAKRKLLNALAQAPWLPDVNAAMGYFLETTGSPKEARAYFQKAMALNPGGGAQMNNYGTFLCRQGDYAAAEQYFLKAAKDVNYENSATAYENAGLCSMAQHDDKKAEDFFSKALEQDPQRAQSLFELVKIEMKSKQYLLVLDNLKKFPAVTMKSKELLSIAVKAAHESNQINIESNYQQHLADKSGVNNEYNDSNG